MNKKTQGEANREWGKQAEQIACDYLVAEGYAIRERNWHGPNRVEIDIIAQKGITIAFIEVKARKGDCVAAYEAVNEAKRRKMIKGGDVYLRSQEQFFYYRMDIITITGTSEKYTLDHLKDAFLPPLS